VTEFGDLRAHQQASLREWRTNYLSDINQQVGLWVCGERRAGSSTIADIALSQAAKGDNKTWEYMLADDVIKLVREQWSVEGVQRGNPSDHDLLMEAYAVEAEVDGLMGYDVLVVDDLHSHSTDMDFWMRHVEKKLMQRSKARKPTIIATDMPPNHPAFTGFQKVIEDLFVICHAER
jgi:hypothetical protein